MSASKLLAGIFSLVLLASAATPSLAQVPPQPVASGSQGAGAPSVRSEPAGAGGAQTAGAAARAETRADAPPSDWFLYGVPIVIVVLLLSAFGWVKRALTTRCWSLAEALSEDTDLPIYQWQPLVAGNPPAAGAGGSAAAAAVDGAPAQGALAPRPLLVDNQLRLSGVSGNGTMSMLLGPDGKPVVAPQMAASTSRLIALIGTMAILFLYVGFGMFALFHFGQTGQVPSSLKDVVSFLVAGLTLFAPYAVNKVSSVLAGTK